MWKKVLVVVIALVGTFSVVYAFNNDLFATTTTYQWGGAVTGRVNKAPSNLSLASGNASIGMQKGDKVLIGETLGSEEQGFQLLKYANGYTDYDTRIVTLDSWNTNQAYATDYDLQSAVSKVPVKAWYSMGSQNETRSTSSITSSKKYYAQNYSIPIDNPTNSFFWAGLHQHTGGFRFFLPQIGGTWFYFHFESYINALDANPSSYKIIAPRDLTSSRQWLQSTAGEIMYSTTIYALLLQESMKHTLFIPSAMEMDVSGYTLNGSATSLASKDSTYRYDYWLGSTRYYVKDEIGNTSALVPNGGFGDIIRGSDGMFTIIDPTDPSTGMATYRPALYLNMDNVVFATSMGTSNGLATVSQPKLSPSYSSIYEETKNDKDMKVRVLNTSLTATLNSMKNASGSTVLPVVNGKSVAAQHSTIQLNADANPLFNSTVSVLIFDTDGNFKYYKPLEAAKGSGNYAFDTTGIDVGKYQVAIVNEVYNDSSTIAADSSLLSSVQNLEIVSPLSYSVSKTAASYEYKNNVNAKDSVATIPYQNGAGDPTFTFDTVNGTIGDATNFELVKSTTSASTYDIKIKENAPALVNGSLKAGDYYFFIKGVDANGDPSSTGAIRVDVKVNKTATTITIDNADKETLKIGEVASGAFTTNNKDLNDTVKPTCTIVSNNSNTLTIKECTATGFTVETNLDYDSTKLPEDITLQVSINDTDNYNATTITAEKTFHVYKELNNFSFTKKINGNYSMLDIGKNATIGTLSVKDGEPTYTYELTNRDVDGANYNETQAEHNDLFEISSDEAGNSIVVTKDKIERIGSYFFQLKVTDIQSKVLYTNVQIDVSSATQSAIQFKDAPDGNNITEKSYEYSQSSVKPSVYAEGGSSDKDVVYSLSTTQPSGVTDASSILEVNSSTGEITMHKTGTVNVTAMKPGGNDYADVSVTIPVTIMNGSQAITFDSNMPTKKVVKDKTFQVSASVSGRSDGSTPSGVTYDSLSTNVCTVDSNGLVTIVTSGTCKIKASNSDANYVEVSAEATIEIYGDMAGTFSQTLDPLPVGTTSGRVVGKIENQSGGDANYTYRFKTASSMLIIESDGTIKLSNTLTVDDLADKWNAKNKRYEINEVIVMKDGNDYSVEIPVLIICKGATLSNVDFRDSVDGTIDKTYELGGSFILSLKGNDGGGIPTYTVQADTQGLLTSVNPNSGSVLIAKAGDTPAVVKAEIPAKNGYEAKTITAKVIINKATQTIKFEPILPSAKRFEAESSFKATAIADVEGTTITYATSPANVCTNNGATVTMKGTGDCTITASGTKENYEDVSTPATTIEFFNGADASFIQEGVLQAKQNNVTIPEGEVYVGVINKSGGNGTVTYAISTNSEDLNKAGAAFVVDDAGNLSLKKALKAQDLVNYATYDSTKDIYVLKIQVDVLDDGVVNITKDFEVSIQGASLDLSYPQATNGIIKKTYANVAPDNYFDLSIAGNLSGGTPSYTYKKDQGITTSEIEKIVKLNGTRVTIQGANDTMPIITAEVPAVNGYAKTQVDVKVKIDKAEQANFDFVDTAQSIQLNFDSRLTLAFKPNESQLPITLISSDPSVLSVNGQTITASKDTAGTVDITATSPGNENYEEKSVTKQVVVFGSLSGQFKQTLVPQVGQDATVYQNVGEFTITGGLDQPEDIVVEWTNANTSNLLTLVGTDDPEKYEIKLSKEVKVDDIKTLYDAKTGKYLIPASITMKDSSGEVSIPANIEITGAQRTNIAFTGAVNGKIRQVYASGGTIDFSLTDNTLTNVTFKQVAGNDTQVLSVGKIGSTYKGFIQNATQTGDPEVVVEATIPAQQGYDKANPTCIVEISKATQVFDFVVGDINFKKGTTITPQFTAVPKGNNGVVVLSNPVAEQGVIEVVGLSLKGKGEGKSTITAKATGNRNYDDTFVTKVATVYDTASLTYTPNTTLPQAETQSGKIGSSVGIYRVVGGLESTVSLDENQVDNAYFELVNDEILQIKKNINASDLAVKPWNIEKQAYEMQVKFTITDKLNNLVTSDETIYVKGAPISNVAFKDSDGNATTKISKPYVENGTFSLGLTGKENSIWPYGTITYRLKDGTNTTNVLSKIDANGLVTIQNANLLNNAEKVMAIATIAPGKGYEAANIETEIFIEKAPQPNFSFKGDSITVEKSVPFQPEFLNLLSNGPVDITFEDTGAATYDKASNSIIATNDTKVFAMSDSNDRNYQVARAQAFIKIKAPDDYIIQIEVPDPAFYGSDDTLLKATVTYRGNQATPAESHWFSSNPDVATIDDAGKITIHNAGITLLHYEEKMDANSVDFVSSLSLKFYVKPKAITVKIADEEKYVGQTLPIFKIADINGILEGDKNTFVSPIYGCQDKNGDEVDAYTGIGEYDIDGYFNTNANPNYNITLQSGKLTIRQDPSKPSWYEVVSNTQPSETGWYNKPVTLKLVQEERYDKISDSIKGPWDETIVVNEEGIQDKDVYFKDTTTNAIAAPQEQTIKVDETKPRITSVISQPTNTNPVAQFLRTMTLDQFFKLGSEITIRGEDVVPNAGVQVSDVASISYKVYQDTPDEEGSTLVSEGVEEGKEVSVVMSNVGDYKVCAIATDNAGNASEENCQKVEVKKIDIDVDGDGTLDFNDSDGDGCPDLNIKWRGEEKGNWVDIKGEHWVIINGDRDGDNIPDLNIDSDGNGYADLNIDSDHDGIPDLNLVVLTELDWTKDTMAHCVISQSEQYCTGTNVSAQINIDEKEDGIPEYNIDNNGDMKADINIKNSESILLNRIPMTSWVPLIDHDYKGFIYGTMKKIHAFTDIDSDEDGYPDINIDFNHDGIPDLNIDSDDDGIPDLNIDGDGDGIADYNIDVDQNGKPSKNVIKLESWTPKQDGTYQNKKFDTMLIEKQEQLEDNDIIVKPSSPNNSFLPNFALRVYDMTKDLQTSLEGKVSISEGQAFVRIYQLALLKDGIQIQPDGSLKIFLPIPKDIKNPVLYMEHEDGTYQKISYRIEDDYFLVETSYVGVICILGDDEAYQPEEPIITPDPPTPKEEVTTPPIVPDNAGGANMAGSATGDPTSLYGWMFMVCSSILVLKKVYDRTQS